MKSQVWSGFTPATSEIENLQGGLMLYDRTLGYDVEAQTNFYRAFDNGTSTENPAWLYGDKSTYFMAISYDLKVSQTHAGWHHYISFYSDRNGISYGGGVVKLACPPGVYKMLLHFQSPLPRVGPEQGGLNLESTLLGENFTTSPLKVSNFGIGTPPNDNHSNIFTFKPILIEPDNAATFFKLYDPVQFNADVGVEGYPISFPENSNPY